MHPITRAATLLLAAACGCTSSPPAPPAAAPAPPSAIVYAAGAGRDARVLAVAEDGSGAPALLSQAGVPTTFAAALPGRRALLAERDDAGAVARLVTVGADGTGRAALASLPAGRYHYTGRALPAGDALIVELSPAEGPADLYALRPGAAPLLLGARAALVAVAGDRVIHLAGPDAAAGIGDARTVRSDGTAPASLGGGDGRDRIAAVRGDLVLVTLHDGPSTSGGSRVRLVRTDGTGAVQLGTGARPEAAFALTAARALYTQRDSAGPALLSAALDGSDARRISPEGRAAAPLGLTPDGRVLFMAGTDLLVADAASGAARTLDRGADAYHAGPIIGDTLVYTAALPDALSLRAVALSGGAPRVLCQQGRWLPIPVAVIDHGTRLVFHRGLAGKPEGGRIYTVPLAGGDLQPLGAVTLAPGGANQPPPSDQDFFAVTPAGRIIFEAEFEGTPGAALLTSDGAAPIARTLASIGPLAYAGLLR